MIYMNRFIITTLGILSYSTPYRKHFNAMLQVKQNSNNPFSYISSSILFSFYFQNKTRISLTKEIYAFTRNCIFHSLLVPEQLSGDNANQIKFDNSPVVTVVSDLKYK